MFLKPSQVATDLNVSPFTIYKLISDGTIPPPAVIRIGGAIRLDSEVLRDLLLAGLLHRRRGRKSRAINAASAASDSG